MNRDAEEGRIADSNAASDVTNGIATCSQTNTEFANTVNSVLAAPVKSNNRSPRSNIGHVQLLADVPSGT